MQLQLQLLNLLTQNEVLQLDMNAGGANFIGGDGDAEGQFITTEDGKTISLEGSQ